LFAIINKGEYAKGGIAWARLQSLAEGAALASKALGFETA
jgi:hypothetical protein